MWEKWRAGLADSESCFEQRLLLHFVQGKSSHSRARSGLAKLVGVTDANKVAQFTALLRPRLAGRGYRLLYTWSRDGRSHASFHQHCDNQVRAIAKAFSVHLVTLQGRGRR